MMRKVLTTTAALVAAVAVSWVLTLPSPPLHSSGTADSDLLTRTLPGAFHVHSNRSDGAAGKEAIAAAAAAAGLRFVVFADHGDGTRAPDPPAYIDGVLCVDAVEISTNGGHYIALGLPQAPYRLGGEAAAVVEDVRRLGGFGVVAHPDSPKRELDWRDWTLDVGGVEWLNADSAWRSQPAAGLARRLPDYFVRPAATLRRHLFPPGVDPAALGPHDGPPAHRRLRRTRRARRRRGGARGAGTREDPRHPVIRELIPVIRPKSDIERAARRQPSP